MLIVYGAHGSPYVRKVCAFLAEKNLPYQIEQTIPLTPNPEYKKISPLGKIPCLKDGEFTVPDSSVICAYLEKKQPEPPLYPSNSQDFARALWFEEYADTALAQLVAGKIFFQKILAPLFLKRPVDEAAIAKVIEEDLPPLFNYLEGQLRDGKPVVGEKFSIADISLTAHLLAFYLAGYQIDKARWPKLNAFMERNLARPSFQNYFSAEKKTFGLA